MELKRPWAGAGLEETSWGVSSTRANPARAGPVTEDGHEGVLSSRLRVD